MIRLYKKLSNDANVFPFVRREDNVEDEHYFLFDDGSALAFDDNEIIGW